MTETSVKDGIATLVVVAADASDNTKKKFNDMCSFYNVPIITYSDKDSLGHFIGKEFRASLAICDKGFSDNIMNLVENMSIM